MKKFFEEFKAFALKGNVMDMAIGVIIGGAFSSIVTALTNSFINPLIAVITGGVTYDEAGNPQIVGGTFEVRNVSFDYGAFISAVINFLIIALVLFCMLKAINTAATKAAEAAKKLAKTKAEEEAAAPAEDPAEIKLMKEMLAIMKEQNPEAAKKAEEKLKA
ncbi:MAG: large conductance mechanosensitive channel protein MscL [Lachnospiraceae bacterium]|nr:large conductance mechanosensitive channel protein MscL [Lachnospiraceae bacterium]